MRREELTELHYIAPIANIASILTHGIVSHQRAESIGHHSVAMMEIQNLRSAVHVPGGRRLHEYVNLYICARNPMMSKLRDAHSDLCVLRVSTDVLDLAGVVVADQNASSKYVRFGPVESALPRIDRDLVFAEYWTHPGDQIEEWRHKSIKCAEVLVPDSIAHTFIDGAFVSNPTSQTALKQLAPGLPVVVDSHLFFR